LTDSIRSIDSNLTSDILMGAGYIEYAHFADDLVILVDGFRKWDWLVKAVYQGLLQELKKT